MVLSAARRWRPSSLVVDVGVTLLVGVVLAVAIEVSREADSAPPDALAYLLGAAIAALTLAWRRRPLAVLLGSAALLLVYLSLQYPGISPALALGVPLYGAAVSGRSRWALGVAAFFLLSGVVVRGVREDEPILAVTVDMVEKTSLMVVVVLLGVAVRAHRLHAQAAARALAAAQAERDRDAARRVAQERLRIARDLHDVLAHTIATVSVQAGVALDVVDDSPGEIRAALTAIRTAGRSATEELRATVDSLRADEDPDGATVSRGPTPSLAQLDRLLAVAGGSGVRVGLERTGEVRGLPQAVEVTAYRIVQESLTNIVRHAGASRAWVAVRYERGTLVVDVVDDGLARADGSPGAGHVGHGIDGMRERVTALAGSFSAGPRPAGGFAVRAVLPTDDPEVAGSDASSATSGAAPAEQPLAR